VTPPPSLTSAGPRLERLFALAAPLAPALRPTTDLLRTLLRAASFFTTPPPTPAEGPPSPVDPPGPRDRSPPGAAPVAARGDAEDARGGGRRSLGRAYILAKCNLLDLRSCRTSISPFPFHTPNLSPRFRPRGHRAAAAPGRLHAAVRRTLLPVLHRHPEAHAFLSVAAALLFPPSTLEVWLPAGCVLGRVPGFFLNLGSFCKA